MTLPIKTAALWFLSISSALQYLHGQISPSGYSYSVSPSGSYPDSGGELTDGTASVTAWPNSTTGAAFAGWNYTNPTFTLNFSSTEKVNEVRVWAADSDGSAGVALPSSITLSTSDGFSKTFTVSNPSGSGNSVSINLQGFCIITNNITVTVNRDASQHWTMISEVQVFGPGSSTLNLGSTSHEFYFGTNNNLSNVISGSGGSINKTGSSTLTPEGNNTYTGGTTVTNGTFKLGHNNAAGTGNISILGGNIGPRGTLDFNGFTISNNITLSNLGTGVNTEGIIQNTNTSSASTLSGTLTIGGENYVGGNGDLTISGLVSGGSNSSYSIYKQGTGTWKFSNNNNTFDGFYYQTAGTTEVTSLANINTASALGKPTSSNANRVVFGYSSQNGVLRFVGSAACSSDRTFVITGSSGSTHKIEGSGTTSSATLSLTGNVSINNSSAQSIVLGGNNAGENSFSGAIQNGSGTLALIKEGSTTWILTGTNTYTGTTTISTGTLKVGNGGSSGELGGNGAIVNNGTLEVNKSSNLTLSRVIQGTGNFVHSGAGITTLSSTNTYTGATSITQGELKVNGSIASSSQLTVSSGAIVSGTGSLPTSTINGIHSPGNSPGLQTFTDGLTYNTGSQLIWELNSNASGTRGTDFDGVDVTGGTLTIQSGVTSNLTFNTIGSTVDWTNSFWNSDHSWLVFDNANAPTASSAIFSTISVSADINNISLNNAAGRKSAYFYWSKTGNDIYLNYVAIAPAITWTGSASTDWGNPANWSPAVLPSSPTNVTIPNVANDPVVNLGSTDPATANDVTVESGAVLTINSGKVLNASGNVQLTGNFSNAGALTCSGTLTLGGSSAQTLAGTLTLNNLTINNSAGVTLNTNINATGTLTMTSGNLTLGNYNATVADVSGGSSSSYVKTSGSGQLTMTIASTISRQVPVGNSAYNPITITNNSGANDNFSVRVMDVVYYKGLDGSAGTAQEPHVTRTWIINKTNPNAGSGIDLTFGWNVGELSSPAPTSFALYAFNGGTNKWDKLSGSSVSGNTLTYTGYTGSVGLFAIGDDIIALPISNLRLSATSKQQGVLVEWLNPDEDNINFYSLQHSSNALQWKTLVQQTSTGKGRYSFLHPKPESNINYYRILATDRNQHTDTSGMVVAIGQKSDAAFIYPNPANQGVLRCNLTEPSAAALFNSIGKLVWKKELPEGPSIMDLQHLPAGTYSLRISGQTISILIL